VESLTPAERRAALVIAALLALGAGRDLWRATRPLPFAPPASGTATEGIPAATGDSDPAAVPSVPAESTWAGNFAPLDLNRSSAKDLESLPGVGPVLARRIVAHRERHGPFRAAEELLAVRGIGPRLLARLRPHVAIGPDTGPSGPAREEAPGPDP